MATYNLAASDLITLLQSTVTAPTAKTILETLLADPSAGAGFPFTNTGVNTTNGPSDVTSLNFPVSGFDTVTATSNNNNGVPTIPYTIALELITVPTSTITGSSFQAGTLGTGLQTASTRIELSTAGGLIVAAGDQNVAVVDDNTGTTADTMIGGAYLERLVSNIGTNVLISGTGANTLIGGAGADTLIGAGQSRLVAGSGNNVLMSSTLSSGADTLIGGTGAAMLIAQGGDNRVVAGTGLNTLQGGSGHDTLIGGGVTNIMLGNGATRVVESVQGAHDSIMAGSGADTIVLADHKSGVADSITGSSGALRIVALSGSNTITGGAGADTIVLTGANGSIPINNTANQTITAGTGGVRVVTSESFANFSVSSAPGGTYTVNYSDTGQTLTINDKSGTSVTLTFGDGHAAVTI